MGISTRDVKSVTYGTTEDLFRTIKGEFYDDY